jgi:multisubunit Na+/H+ antiporter MnhC subunit
MSAATLAGLIGAALVGLGLFGLITHPQPLRKILAFNLIGSGVFLLFGIIARRGAAAGFAADPVPQAMVITGIVVAFAASVLSAWRRFTLRRLWHARYRPSRGPDSRRARRLGRGRADDGRIARQDGPFPAAFMAAAGPCQRAGSAERRSFGAGYQSVLFLIVRLWFSVLPALPSAILATLGSAAILSGSVLALRQERLKLLIAYSTVAQIGYLFLMFPLASGTHPWAADAWSGGLMQTLSHAFAKAAMFLAAGLVAESLGHDRIAGLGGVGRAMPMTIFALGLGGLSLMGLPPSGGFAAKWLLLKASVEAAAVMLAGGLLAGGYIYRVLAPALASGSAPLRAPPQRSREAIALALALFAVLLGFAPPAFFAFLQIGRPAAMAAPP